MASSTWKSGPVKRLAEFLQEQQEPYTLNICRSKEVLKNSRRAFEAQQVVNSEAIPTKRQWGSMAKRRQIILRLQQSLVTSALNNEAETLSSGSPMLIQSKENATFSGSLRDLPSMTTKHTFYSTPWDNRPGFSKYVRDRVAIKQTTQLLLDYANKAKIHKKGGNGNCTREMFVIDELTV